MDVAASESELDPLPYAAATPGGESERLVGQRPRWAMLLWLAALLLLAEGVLRTRAAGRRQA